jgi:hypothetical protein
VFTQRGGDRGQVAIVLTKSEMVAMAILGAVFVAGICMIFSL